MRRKKLWDPWPYHLHIHTQTPLTGSCHKLERTILMGLAEDLENDGFDQATAVTISELAHNKTVNDASTLLVSVLGEGNSITARYIQQRENEQLKKLNEKLSKKVSNVTLKYDKKKHNEAKKTQYSASDKIDAVKDIESVVDRLSKNPVDRKACDCLGLKHGLLENAPNCLNCGRIVCKFEGLGPCLSCHTPLLPNEQIEQILKILNEKKSGIVATMSKKALHAAGIDPASKPDIKAIFNSTAEAEKHLERTLGFQAEDAERTKIVDQVSDVDVVTPGVNQWATPAEQAEQMRLQQRKLRVLKEKEKTSLGRGRKVLSIDIRGNKIYQVERDAPITEQELLAEERENFKEEESVTEGEGEEMEAQLFYEPSEFSKPKLSTDYASLSPTVATAAAVSASANTSNQCHNNNNTNSNEQGISEPAKIIRDNIEIMSV